MRNSLRDKLILSDPKQISGCLGLGAEGGIECKGAPGYLGGGVGISCILIVVVFTNSASVHFIRLPTLMDVVYCMQIIP